MSNNFQWMLLLCSAYPATLTGFDCYSFVDSANKDQSVSSEDGSEMRQDEREGNRPVEEVNAGSSIQSVLVTENGISLTYKFN